jgi:serine protease Do
MQSTKSKLSSLLLSTALVAGIAGVGIGQTGMLLPTPVYADAVKLQAPAVFSFGDVVEAVSPAVVSVRVEAKIQPASDQMQMPDTRHGREFFERFFQQGPRGDFRNNGPRQMPKNAKSQGSGFFVSDDGYLVTNNHVIEGGTNFTIVLNDGTEYEASLVGTDPRTDLAVLKVDADTEFTYVDFGKKRPRTGDWVVAVGNPFGLGGTVTAGIVSAHGREIGATRYDDFLQIDAAVNKGNSGGPAFNLEGEVIGVNTAIFSPSGGNVGIAFAIPAALANEVVSDLIEDGSVTRGWLGVQIQPVTPEIAESLGLDLDKGTIVTSAQQGSPAADAGLKSGDVISEVEGKPIKSPRALARVIAGFEPNSDISLKVWRDGEAMDVSVTLGELEQTAKASPKKPNEKRRLGKLGLALEQTEEGLRVTQVRPNSPAAEKGLRAGDIISSVNGDEVTSTSSLREALKDVRKSGRKSALLQVKRDQRTLFVPVPVDRG